MASFYSKSCRVYDKEFEEFVYAMKPNSWVLFAVKRTVHPEKRQTRTVFSDHNCYYFEQHPTVCFGIMKVTWRTDRVHLTANMMKPPDGGLADVNIYYDGEPNKEMGDYTFYALNDHGKRLVAEAVLSGIARFPYEDRRECFREFLRQYCIES